MVLSDVDIRRYMAEGKLKISPELPPEQFGLMKSVMVPAGESFILQPREFSLATTEETLELDDDVPGGLEGRSSLGHIGIIVHGTAGLFDPGSEGKALDISNLGRMPLASRLAGDFKG